MRSARTSLLLLALAAPSASSAQRPPPEYDLAPTSVLGDTAPDSQLALSADGVLLARGSGPRHLRAYEAATGRLLGDWSAQPNTPRWLLLPHAAQPVGALLLGANSGSVLALDIHDGRERFRTAVAPQGRVLGWSSAALFAPLGLWVAAMHHFVYSGDEEGAGASTTRYELVALRLADGALAWRLPLEGDVTALADEAALYTVSWGGVVSARDPRTGAPRWTRDLRSYHSDSVCPTPVAPLVVPNGLALGCGNGRARVLAAATGQDSSEVTLAPSGYVRPLARTHEGLLASLHAREPDGSTRSSVAALGGSPLRVRWRSPERRTRGHEQRVTALGETLFFHCGDAGSVEALSLRDGTVQWSWGLARCVDLAAARTAGGTRLFVSDGSAVRVFAPSATPPAMERARVEGVVRRGGAPLAGVTVRVGSAVVRSDTQGRFAVETSAIGALTAEVLALPDPIPSGQSMLSGQRVLTLDGRAGPYTLELDAAVGSIDFHFSGG